MKNLYMSAIFVFGVASAYAGDGHRYDYNFPVDKVTPFESWNTALSTRKSEDKEAAEFSAIFAAKMMTIVVKVEDTKTGKRTYVIVANQHCIIDIVRHEKEYRTTTTKCSTIPFGTF